VDAWTVYIGGIYELRSDSTETKYYSAFGRSIAMSVNGTVHYLLGDHLGSTSMVVSESGVVEMERRYWPYGATRSETGAQVTDKLYTGQRKEEAEPALGLYNYKARFYSTTLGRFVSADPVSAAPATRSRGTRTRMSGTIRLLTSIRRACIATSPATPVLRHNGGISAAAIVERNEHHCSSLRL
jgi:RHS repeat-associated protein